MAIGEGPILKSIPMSCVPTGFAPMPTNASSLTTKSSSFTIQAVINPNFAGLINQTAPSAVIGSFVHSRTKNQRLSSRLSTLRSGIMIFTLGNTKQSGVRSLRSRLVSLFSH